MSRPILFFFLCVLPAAAMASLKKVNLSDAIRDKMVKMKAVNVRGAYTGRAVELSLTNNNKKDSLDVTVNLGVILKPEDSSYQPMVLAGEEQIVLEPGKKGEVLVQIFCGNSPMHCPRKDLKFTYGRMGSEKLQKVLRYINDHRLFDHLGQSAVWAMTNDHPPRNIYDRNRDSLSKQLISLVCGLTGKPLPEYYSVTEQNEVPGEAAYTAKTEGIVAQFDVTLRGPQVLTIGLFDEKNQMLEALVDRRMFATGHHNLEVSFDTEPYGAGRYYIRLMGAEKMLKEKKITVEK